MERETATLNREEAVNLLVEAETELCFYNGDMEYFIRNVMRNGMRGIVEMSEEELIEEYQQRDLVDQFFDEEDYDKVIYKKEDGTEIRLR